MPGTDGPDASGRIRREERIAASPEEVWRAWTDPAGLATWFVDRAEGRARPGEEMRWIWERFGFEGRVRVREARAPERLVLELLDTPGRARVLEIDIAGAHGGTRLRIVESGFSPDDSAAADVGSGWTLALGTLRLALEQYRGLPRTDLLVLEPAVLRPPLSLLATTDGLARWLCTRDAGVVMVPGIGRFDGDLLATSSSEALWSWPAPAGALALKVFGPPHACTAGVHLSVWGEGREVAALEPALRAAVSRLIALL